MFKIYRAKIPHELINDVLSSHQKFKNSKFSIFRAQGTNAFENPKLDEFNNQINSIQNPHLLGISRGFRKAHDKIIFHKNISNSLKEFTGEDDHIHFQSMFFDKSTGTQLHQDTWYLDTNPRGKLVGVWIALEKITLESGPFVVYTNTDNCRVEPDLYNFKDLDNDIRFAKDYPNSTKYRFLAEKGDILIWDSFSIHGADQPIHPNFTRKSITSHFYPKKYLANEPPVKRIFSIYNHKKPLKTENNFISKAATVNPYFYSILCILFKFFKPIKFLLLRDKLLNKKQKNIIEIREIEKK